MRTPTSPRFLRATPTSRTPVRRGFTLVEVLVVLLILALGTSLVVGWLVWPERGETGALADALQQARRAALRRAGAVTMVVDRDGEWRVTAGEADSIPVKAGTLRKHPGQSLRIHISALGHCLPDDGATPALDPLACTPLERTDP